jgi:hypothetical protein
MMVKAQVGDYIRFAVDPQAMIPKFIVERVEQVEHIGEFYVTSSGKAVDDWELSLDDVLLESEVEL